MDKLAIIDHELLNLKLSLNSYKTKHINAKNNNTVIAA